jgi:hypothetical protein
VHIQHHETASAVLDCRTVCKHAEQRRAGKCVTAAAVMLRTLTPHGHYGHASVMRICCTGNTMKAHNYAQ